jgi:hypothetical protein
LNGIAVGLNGIIYCTRNGGATWTAKTSGTNEWLLDISMPNDSTGFAVGGFGTILKSSDFGGTWSPLSSGTNEWLTSVSFLDDSFGVATGNHGVILRTRDAGQYWEDVSPPKITFDFTSVSLFQGSRSANRGAGSGRPEVVVVGYGGTILFSPDGGDTWIEQDSKTRHPLLDCHFTDSVHGAAVGFYGTILRTEGRDSVTVGLEDYFFEEKAKESLLGKNYPNPFSVSTRIPFDVPYKAPVDLRIFDLKGQMVDRLINEEFIPGAYEYEWKPDRLPEGVYVCRLQVGYKSYSRKLVWKR